MLVPQYMAPHRSFAMPTGSSTQIMSLYTPPRLHTAPPHTAGSGTGTRTGIGWLCRHRASHASHASALAQPIADPSAVGIGVRWAVGAPAMGRWVPRPWGDGCPGHGAMLTLRRPNESSSGNHQAALRGPSIDGRRLGAAACLAMPTPAASLRAPQPPPCCRLAPGQAPCC